MGMVLMRRVVMWCVVVGLMGMAVGVAAVVAAIPIHSIAARITA